jgi:hypothetical protein
MRAAASAIEERLRPTANERSAGDQRRQGQAPRSGDLVSACLRGQNMMAKV